MSDFGCGKFAGISGLVILDMPNSAAFMLKRIPVFFHRIPNGTDQAHACNNDPAQMQWIYLVLFFSI